MQSGTSMETADDSFQPNISAELVNILYSQAFPAITGSLIVATCLCYILYHVIPNSLLFGWYFFVLAVSVVRYSVVKLYFDRKPLREQSNFWEKLFVCSIALSSISWSLPGTLLMPPNTVYETFIGCSLAAMAAGATPFLSGSRAACVCFIIPILFPFSITLFLQGNTMHQLLGLLVFLYLTLLLISSFRTHNTLYNAIKLKFQNEALVKEMAKINKTLQVEMHEKHLAEKLLRESREDRINYLATHDALTDLPNRNLFHKKFTQALERAKHSDGQLALLFVDLDHFKNINDTLGHDVGDKLLKKVASRIKNCLSELDTIARFGGDEFAILLEEVHAVDVVKMTKKIHNVLIPPFQLNKKEVFITTSIGISVYPDDGTQMQILLKNADLAVFRAKEQGRNTFEFFTQQLNERILKKITIEDNLRIALEKQELSVYYQPIMDLANNRIASFEAVLRWHHPLLGFIPPDEFVPVAEELGLIIPIGEWVLREVCQQALIWQNAKEFPVDARIAINLSARQFKEPNLTHMVTSILKETGLQGKYITLELTESLIMSDIAYSANVINMFKSLGIVISIDDFGTGYSSLSYLRKFPIDILKIDRSFITDIGYSKNSDDAAAIVKAIIVMAHSLKMKVIAEGVETAEQHAFLIACGCDEIQGYLLSQPMPAVEVIPFLKSLQPETQVY